jgi:hypothetical protein
MSVHNIHSFIAQGLKEWTTLLGITALIFITIYHKEINQLIDNVLTSQLLAEKIINGLAAAAAFGFIVYKEKK